MQDARAVHQHTDALVSIVAGCVIKKDGKYLLVQEKLPKAYGLWNLPAGHVDKGETIEQAAVREVKEEAGYDVRLLKKIGVYHESADSSVKHVFLAEITGGELAVQAGEILDAKWLTYAEIQALHDDGKIRAELVFDSITKIEAV